MKKERAFLSVTVFSLIIFSLPGCQNQKEPETGLRQIQFNVDSNLLSQEVIDSSSKFLFMPPKEWKLINKKLFKDVLDKNNLQLKQEEKILIAPLYIFMDDSMNCLLNISRIQLKEENKSQTKSTIAIYEEELLRKFGKEKLKRAEYLKGNLAITQYLINENNEVNFKIIFFDENKNLVQFDYVTSLDVYPKEIKAIESSIGSIQLLK